MVMVTLSSGSLLHFLMVTGTIEACISWIKQFCELHVKCVALWACCRSLGPRVH